MIFKDRAEAGRKLAEELRDFTREEAIIYAIPRGGVVVGAVVAEKLKIPLGLVVTRKIGHPIAPEYAIAAVTEDGILVASEGEVANLDKEWFRAEVERQKTEARRRREAYLGGAPPMDAKGKTAIIIDDGLATGLSMRAAIGEIKRHVPRAIVVAVPVASKDTREEISRRVDRVICLYVPEGPFSAVGEYYKSFPQVADKEVVALLRPWRSR